ncbi:hypothetical protein LPJ64_000537 [Coemansia asiatica]|uniref:Alpha-galactosidase n=1 Tax=Coemansia asiatica TaxID=1052880 RepID=A0A9W7XQ88_9FUNG|nr:hypothetical protein LPJ64_000537 [Coemansia asiatica]
MAQQVHIFPPLGVLTQVREPVMSFRVYFVLDRNVVIDGNALLVQSAEVWSNIFNGEWKSIALHTEDMIAKQEHETLDFELAFIDKTQVAGQNSSIQRFGLDLPISDSMQKLFEFTVRWQDSSSSTWHWAGGVGQNAQVSLACIGAADPCRRKKPLLPSFWRQRLRSIFHPAEPPKDDDDHHHHYPSPVAVADSWHMSLVGASCLFKSSSEANTSSTSTASAQTQIKAQSDRVISLGRLSSVQQYLAFVRKDPFWIIPHAGNSIIDTGTMDIVLLLVELDLGTYVALMPFVRSSDTNCVAVLRSYPNNGLLQIATSSPISSGSVRVAAAINARPNDAVEELFLRIQQCIPSRTVVPSLQRPSVQSKHSDAVPDTLLEAHMGYCTWNAFYQQVSHQSVVRTIRAMRDTSIKDKSPFPAWAAIDDGWQSVSSYDGFGKLCDIFANSEKFPGQLKQTTNELKDLGIRRIGVWHALWGYWGGIDPQGPLAKRYKIEKYHRMRSPVAEECDVWLIASSSIQKFYSDFYSWLGSQGISFVKVDYQAAFETLQGYSEGKVSEMYNAYLNAAEQAAYDHLGPGSVIHCMAQSPHIIMRALQQLKKEDDVLQNAYSSCFAERSLFRNSDDYFPNVSSSHAWHIYCNMANTVWSRFLRKQYVADWDMFQPSRQGCHIHAVSRVLSGGPVYITGDQKDCESQRLSLYVGNAGLITAVEPPMLDVQSLFMDMTVAPRFLIATTCLPDAEAVSISVFNTTANALISPISLARVYADRSADICESAQQMAQPGYYMTGNSNTKIKITNDNIINSNSSNNNNSGGAGGNSDYFALYQQSTNHVLMVPKLPAKIAIALQPLGCDLISVFRMTAIRSGDRSTVLYAACLGDTSRFVSASVVERSVYGVLPRPSSIGSNSSLSSNYTPPASPSIYSSRQWNIRARVAYQPTAVAFALLAFETTLLARKHPSITVSSIRVSGYDISDSCYWFCKSTGILTIDTSPISEMTSISSITITLTF